MRDGRRGWQFPATVPFSNVARLYSPILLQRCTPSSSQQVRGCSVYARGSRSNIKDVWRETLYLVKIYLVILEA